MATNGKCIVYYRVSMKAQAVPGLGLDAQRETVASYLNGGAWQVLAEYQEVERGSGKSNARPALAMAIAHANSAAAKLVIAKLEGLVRNAAFISSLVEGDVDFVAADLPQTNKSTAHVLAAAAEQEADTISKRTKAALAAAKARGAKLGNPANLTTRGKARGSGATEAKSNEYYKPLAKRIIAAREQGTSFGAIAAELNASGEVTLKGQLFKAMTVQRVFERFNDKENKPMLTTRKKRHPLMEEIPASLLALLADTERQVAGLHELVSNDSLEEPVRAAARHYVTRYESLAGDPDRWVPTYIDGSIDKIVAMSRFLGPTPDALVAHEDRVSIDRQLRRQGYWAWMRNDLDRLRSGHRVHEPFLCEVPDAHIGQRAAFKESAQDAAEYYQLTNFLPAYYRATGKVLSYVRKGLPLDKSGIREPDFIVRESGSGEDIGLEMTDAVGRQQAARSRFFWGLTAELEELLGAFQGSVVINDRQYGDPTDIQWEAIARKHRESFLGQILERLNRTSRGEFSVTVADEPGLKDILVSFRRKRGHLFIMQSDQFGWEGDEPERVAGKNLVAALSNKIDTTDPYSTTRTFLVVYPLREHVLGNYDEVLRVASSDLNDVMLRNHRFHQVWISAGTALWELHSVGTQSFLS